MNPSILKHRPNSNRLAGYDYTQPGAYFVTIVTYKHTHLLGEVINGEMKLNPFGKIAYDQWMRLRVRFPSSEFSSFVIMPNHVHAVIFLQGAGEDFKNALDQNSPLRPYLGPFVNPGSLGAIVRAYKATVSYRINLKCNRNQTPIWQRNYYDHIIRNEADLENIWKYIEGNPAKWDEDRFHS